MSGAETLRHSCVQSQPATQVDSCCQGQRPRDPRIDGPRVEEGLYDLVCRHPWVRHRGASSTAQHCRHDRRACWWFLGWTQGLHEGDHRRHLSRRQVLAIRWHVAPPLQHLTDELILGESRAHPIECRATMAPFTAETMAITTLLVLDDQGPLELQGR